MKASKTTFAQQVARHLRECYVGPNMPGINLRDTLDGVSLAQAQRKIGDHNSILALVFHLDYYVQGLTRVLLGGDLTISDRFSYDFPVLTSEVAWQNMLKEVFANGRKLSELIEQLDDDELNGPFVKLQYGNNYRNLAGLTEHCYYHLGQIALIKKLMNKEMNIFLKLHTQCAELEAEFSLIPTDRQQKLLELAHYVKNKLQSGASAKLNVICTHNSRRSHLGQLWLAVAADYYGISGLQTFSGGTEATALNPRVVSALREIGFQITPLYEEAENPVYQVSWSQQRPPYAAFSKAYDQPPNPKNGFGAILVCTEADAACPTVIGADLRLSLPFEDPKISDGTNQEAAIYAERSRQIGREMLYALSKVKVADSTDLATG